MDRKKLQELGIKADQLLNRLDQQGRNLKFFKKIKKRIEKGLPYDDLLYQINVSSKSKD